MPTIHNTQLIKGLIDQAKINIAVERVPTQLAEKIVPVLETHPNLTRELNQIHNISKQTTGGVNIWVTPPDQDFYLTNAFLTMIKDAACNMGTGDVFISATIGGIVKTIISISTITLTAQNETVHESFKPLKLDRNTAVVLSLVGAYGLGVMNRTGVIKGYTV